MVVGVLVGLVLLAALVTLTTRTTALVDVVVRVLPAAARGRRRPGADRAADRAGHPVRCRSWSGWPRRCGTPSARAASTCQPARVRRPAVVRSLRHADALGEALAARGARRLSPPRRSASGTRAVHTGSVTRWRTRLIAEGTTPDPRMSLANERTFLAWVRTSLAMIAGGISLDAFVDETIPAGVRVTLSVLLLALGAALAIGSFQRWLAAERALRRGDELPVTGLAPLVAGGLTVVAVVLILAVLLYP